MTDIKPLSGYFEYVSVISRATLTGSHPRVIFSLSYDTFETKNVPEDTGNAVLWIVPIHGRP